MNFTESFLSEASKIIDSLDRKSIEQVVGVLADVQKKEGVFSFSASEGVLQTRRML